MLLVFISLLVRLQWFLFGSGEIVEYFLSKFTYHNLGFFYIHFCMQFLAQWIDISVISLGLNAGHQLLPHVFKIHILFLDIFQNLLIHCFKSFLKLVEILDHRLILRIKLWFHLSKVFDAVSLCFNSSHYLIETWLFNFLIKYSNQSLYISKISFLSKDFIILWFIHFPMESLCYWLFACLVWQLLLETLQSIV